MKVSVIKIVLSIFSVLVLQFTIFSAIKAVTVLEYKKIGGSIEHIEMSEPLRLEIHTAYDGFSRVDILFKNPELRSHDTYSLKILDKDNNVIAKRVVSGYNIGDPGEFRIDFPKQHISKNCKYEVVIEPLEVHDNLMKLAVNKDSGEIITKTYYRTSFGFNTILSESAACITRYIQTNIGAFVILAVLFYLLI
jgi:hypothetical protein